ncbi:BMP family lipoprotein [Streptomyces violaceusniger]|uniref:BMP family ABC transporter substrate-binding protein n=1 Tax=Streptomyces violaceusniger TaxID=68280 RepID=A0A4D4KUJ8_STRVO|nr:BMP family ABC transporter substrate-binding protein [Streptomyces violaceusniger]
MRSRVRTPVLALATVTVLTLSACGGKAPATSSAAGSKLPIGIFVDNAFGDGDFFDQAAAAERPLRKKLGAKVTTYEGRLQAQNFEPLLQDAASANKLVFVLGFEAIDAVRKVAKANPKTTFVFVDGVVGGGDVVSAQFRTAEGCFMAGALAGVAKEKGKEPPAAGFIGGVDAPVVQRCRAGFVQGVKKLAPTMAVKSKFVGSFTDPAKGKENALTLADQGAYAIFSYAGLSGAGGFNAAKSGASVSPIGVVSDKSKLAPGKVPGSLIMGVDSVMISIAQRYQKGGLHKGAAFNFGLRDGGWKMVYDQALTDGATRNKLDGIQKQIVAGDIKVSDPGMR